MIRSKSCGSLFKRNIHSAPYSNFLTEIDKSICDESSLYSISCYYDAIPYLQTCRERHHAIRDHDGPLTLIFDCFAQAVPPVRQINNNKLTFQQICEANETICLLELLMFCDFWRITTDAFVSRFEISALFRITLKLYPELKHGVLNQDAFCDFICYLAIVVYSKTPLQSKTIDTNSRKIQAFINKFKLNDLEYVKAKLFVPKTHGFEFNRWKFVNDPIHSPTKNTSHTRKLNRKRRSISKIQIGSMNTMLFEDNTVENTKYSEYIKYSDAAKRTRIIPSAVRNSSHKMWSLQTTKELMSLSKYHFMITRKLLRQNVKYDWRKYKGNQIDMRCLRYCIKPSKYRYKIVVLNCSSQRIRLDVRFESRLFTVKFKGGYFVRGMKQCIYIETIKKNRIARKQDERCVALTVYGINRKGVVIWQNVIPIYYKRIPRNNRHQNLGLQKEKVLPLCVTPLTFN
eukprot:711536_1